MKLFSFHKNQKKEVDSETTHKGKSCLILLGILIFIGMINSCVNSSSDTTDKKPKVATNTTTNEPAKGIIPLDETKLMDLDGQEIGAKMAEFGINFEKSDEEEIYDNMATYMAETEHVAYRIISENGKVFIIVTTYSGLVTEEEGVQMAQFITTIDADLADHIVEDFGKMQTQDYLERTINGKVMQIMKVSGLINIRIYATPTYKVAIGELDTTYETFREWKPNDIETSIGLDILLHDELEKEEIITLLTALSKDKSHAIIRAYTSKEAYYESENDIYDDSFDKEYILYYIKAKIDHEIRWMQVDGKYSGIDGGVTKL